MRRPRRRAAPRPSAGRAATIRRRRVTALAVVLAVLLGTGLLVRAAVSGSGGATPTFVPSGGGSASVIAPAHHRPPRHRASSARFRPAPAAVSLAADLPLERQVSQLFMVTPVGSTAAGVAALGSIDWGGVVLDSSNVSSDTQGAALPFAALVPAAPVIVMSNAAYEAFDGVTPRDCCEQRLPVAR